MKNRDTIIIIISLIISLILLNCSKDSDSASPTNGGSSTGKGGSMARFAISGDNLYAVNNNSLNLFNVSDPNKPILNKVISLGWGVETIFPYKNNLFLGTSTGMYIFDNTDPSNPKQISLYSHIFSCDPVVVEGNYAYITLRSGSSCRQGSNRLEIVNIEDLKNPREIATYNMTQPFGLGIDKKNLFICDDGLKVYDVTDPLNIKLKQHFKISAYDVIPLNGLLVVIGSGGLYQYMYNDTDIQLVSKLNLPLQ